MSVESEVSDMIAFAQSVPSSVIGESIEAFSWRILAAVEAERREWRKERLTWERRVKMAANVSKAKGGAQ